MFRYSECLTGATHAKLTCKYITNSLHLEYNKSRGYTSGPCQAAETAASRSRLQHRFNPHQENRPKSPHGSHPPSHVGPTGPSIGMEICANPEGEEPRVIQMRRRFSVVGSDIDNLVTGSRNMFRPEQHMERTW